MGSASQPLSEASQILSRTQSFNTNASGAATITFPNPPAGFTWTGTLSCALASTGSVFLATVGGVSWGEWGGNSVYGPVQVLGNGGQQLVVTVTGLAASTNYVLQWNGSSDPSHLVAAVWPDSNSTALTAQISGTVPVTVSNTVATNTNITGGSVGVTGSVTTNPLAPAADLVHQGTYTTTWVVPPTITLVNETETNTYVGFMVVFTAMFYTTHIGQGGSFVFTNTVTGQVQKTYVPTIRTDYAIGLQTYFPVPVDSGNAYNITFVPATSASGGSVNIAWNIIGYRQPPVNTVISSNLASLNTVPYGGLLNSQLTLPTATSGVFPGTTTDGTSQVTRLQTVAAVMTSAAAAITGYVSFCDATTAYPVAAIDMTQGTSATHAASMLLNGVLLTNGGGLLVNNQTNKTLLVSTYFDVLSYPNIS